MAYIKNTWVDQEVERPKTYEMVNNSDGSVTLVDSFGLVSELGTPVNADNMNHIEEGIGEHESRITVLENLPDKYLNKSQITNCLLEVPQRIKLELNNGVLTLKAGSEVIVPNGFEADGVTPKFEYKTLATDVSRTGEGNTPAPIPLFMQTTDMKLGYSMEHFSGDTDPKGLSAETFKIWYDTKNNIVKVTSDGGNTWVTNGYSLPFALISLVNQISAINQVFNGFGYIGSTIWVDKGVKGLIPARFNGNGSFKSAEITTNKLSIGSIPNDYANFVGINNLGVPYFADKTYYYNEKENINIQNNSQWDVCVIADISCANGKITNFRPKQPFRAVDYNDKPEISGWAMPSSKYIDLALGASGTTYTAPANGFYSVKKVAGVTNAFFNLHNVTSGLTSQDFTSVTANHLRLWLPCKKGDLMQVEYSATGNTMQFRFNYAEGEV